MAKYLWVTILVSVAMFLAMGALGYSQEEKTNSTVNSPELKWISGTVSQSEFVKSFIMVATNEGYLTFTVTDNTIIRIGPDKVDLSEIQPEDTVRIQYYSPEPGKYVAVSISESRKENNQD